MDAELKAFLQEYYDPLGAAKEPALVRGNLLTPLKEIAYQMLDARHRKHLTQLSLAERCGLSQPVIARLESGKENPNLKTLLKVC